MATERPAHTNAAGAGVNNGLGDLPKIRGEREGDPSRPGSPPGIQPGGPLLGVTVRLGGEIVERRAGDVPEAVQRVEPVPAPGIAPAPEHPTVAPPHESISGDTIMDDPAPRALADILAEEAVA